MASFRYSVWDPMMIIAQILCLQCWFYLCLGMWTLLLNYVVHYDIHVTQLFVFNTEGTVGFFTLSAYLLNALSVAIALVFVVQRAKQCVDFSVTTHVIHGLICMIYNEAFPPWQWWLANILAAVMTSVVSEYVSMHYEMAAIPLVGGQTRNSRTTQNEQ